MTRERRSLDGPWQFLFTDNGRPDLPGAAGPWRTVHVPAPWQAQFDDLRLSHGSGWYRREFETPAAWRGDPVRLYFGAVNYLARVWLDGVFLGEHEGGYLPFEFEIGGHLGEHTVHALVVQAHLPDWDDPQIPFAEIPHGKQSWYGPAGGIWQSVWIERRPDLHLAGLRVDAAGGSVRVRATTSGPLPAGTRLTFEVAGPDGEPVAEAWTGEPETVLRIADPLPWSPEAPHLYTLTAGLGADRLTATFGFRTIAVRDGRLLLNGRPLYLRGALDQDYYPDTLSTPPSTAFIEDQIRKAKAMGLNCLRVHLKIADPRYLEAADRLGMLIWAELPNWKTLTPGAAARAKATLAGMVARDRGHPAVIIWTIVNEAWGTELVSDPRHRAWLAEMVAWLKVLDPTRLVVDNSPCAPNFHVRSDLDDFHFYAAMPDGAADWDRWVSEFASRPDWLYAPEHQARGSDRPLLVSEFGNWGLPDVSLLDDDGRSEPWWFDTGRGWSPDVVHPRGVRDRFEALGLAQVFGDLAGLAAASQRGQFEALQYQIETLRLQPGLSGYVITEFTDVHWEANGLLDPDRRPKAYFDRMVALQADTLLIPRPEQRALWAGQVCRVALAVSHLGPNPIRGALAWRLAVPGQEAVRGRGPEGTAAPFETARLELLEFVVPPVPFPVAADLELSLVDPAGREIAGTAVPLTLFPQPAEPGTVLDCPDPALAERLVQAGYRRALRPAPGAGPPIALTALDAAALFSVRAGRSALLLAATPAAVQTPVAAFELCERAGTPLAGSWASTFAWLQRDRFGGRIPGDGRLDFSYLPFYPETVIAGGAGGPFERDVLAGIFAGWLHRPAALIRRFRIGRGRLTVCTLRLADQVGTDPLATALFGELVNDLAAGDWGE